MTGTSKTEFVLALIIWAGFIGAGVFVALFCHMVYESIRDWWTDGRIKPPKRQV